MGSSVAVGVADLVYGIKNKLLVAWLTRWYMLLFFLVSLLQWSALR